MTDPTEEQLDPRTCPVCGDPKPSRFIEVLAYSATVVVLAALMFIFVSAVILLGRVIFS